MTILVWCRNKKRQLSLGHQVYRLATTSIKHGPAKEMPLWARRACNWETCLLWEVNNSPVLPLFSAELLIYHGVYSKDCQYFLLKHKCAYIWLELLSSSQDSLLLQTSYSALGSNLIGPPTNTSFELGQMPKLYFPFISLLVITPPCHLHYKRWTRS